MLSLAEKALRREHPDTLQTVNNLAGLYFAQRDWREANQYWRRSTAAIARRVQRGAEGAGLIGKTKSEAQQNDGQFWGLVKVAYRLATEMFETAQWALSSEAAQSLAQMAVRGAKGDPAALGRETAKRNAKAEAENRERMAASDKCIVEIDAGAEGQVSRLCCLGQPGAVIRGGSAGAARRG